MTYPTHPKLAIVYGIFGTYHLARYLACHESNDFEVTGIEVCGGAGATKVAGWRANRDSSLGIHTLFPGKHYSDVAPGEIRKSVRETLDRLQPDGVAVNGYVFPDALESILWCRRNGKTAILMSDSKYDDSPRTKWKEWLKKQLLLSCDAALLAGKPHVEYARRLGIPSEVIRTAYDVVDNEFFKSQAEELRSNTDQQSACGLDRNFFLTPARFIWEKNLPVAMEAYAAYVNEFGEEAWNWVLCGDGPLRKEIEEKRQALSLEEHVHITGFITPTELAKYYAWGSAVWLPSISETWGLVINEAMACGLPVLVSSQAGCHYDLVHPGRNGWVFDPKNIDDMSNALARMHRLTPEQRKAMARASQEIISEWSPETFSKNLFSAFEAGRKLHRGRLNLVGRMLLRR